MNPFYQQHHRLPQQLPQQYAHIGDYIFPGHVPKQQQLQEQENIGASGGESPQYSYGNYHLQQHQQESVPNHQHQLLHHQQQFNNNQENSGANSDGPQPQYAYPPQYHHQQAVNYETASGPSSSSGYRGPFDQVNYIPYGQQHYQHQPYQTEESSNQDAVSYQSFNIGSPNQDMSSSDQGSSHGLNNPVVADQDGISHAHHSSPQQHSSSSLMTSGSSPSAQHSDLYSSSGSYVRSKYYPKPESYQFSARPVDYSGSATIDVHKVLDSFIRSAGLSPQGDHENVKKVSGVGNLAYAASGLKPVLSVKKLISYPFYFSSSGDKPTSYGSNNIR